MTISDGSVRSEQTRSLGNGCTHRSSSPSRLVAWLRRIGMPLARIRVVCALAPDDAAKEVRAYWRHVGAETEARRELANFLVVHLSGRTRT